MNDDTSARFDILTLSEAELVDQACDRFETAWRGGDWPCIEGYLDAVAERCRVTLLHELIKLELELRIKVGEQPTAVEYRRRFPDQASAIEAIVADMQEPRKDRSTLPDEVLGSAAPNPDAITLDARTLDLDPRNVVDLPNIDGALGRLLGEYVILDRLGSGGMGVVYRAFQRNANRMVALKLIKADWCGESTEASNREAERRFRTEAQVLAGLEHDHIVTLYDAGHAEGLLFFSMRLINGRSLGQMVLSDGPLAPRRAAYYIEAIARAIQYAHEHKVVHRDVKPGNILVGENDRPYLIDLGLAKSLEATDYTTLTGKALGTAEYMSPEQARGDDDVGVGADVYGLGATLFTLLTGRPPFSGPSPIVVLRKVIDEEPAWPRERDKPVGAELKAICLKCLEKNPANRFSSASELAVVLKKYLIYEPTGVSRPRPWARLGKWVRRQPWRAAAAGLAVLAFLIAGAAWAWNAHKSRAMAEVLLRDLQTIPIADLPIKIEQMAPYRGWVNPRLRGLMPAASRNPEKRTRLLLALLPAEPELASELADRMLECGHDEHRAIRTSLSAYWPSVMPTLHAALADSQADLSRRARAAAALIARDGSDTPAEPAWSELRLAEDPGRRVELLDWLIRSQVSVDILVNRLETERELTVRRELLQTLGALGHGEPPAGASATLAGRMLTRYRDDPDPGIHSSVAYLLRRWGMDRDVKLVDAQLAGRPRGPRDWYVNSVGITMAMITVPDAYRPLPPAPVHLPERFSIATTETSLALYQEFDPTHAATRKEEYGGDPPTVVDGPVDVVNYFDAARFCNWLSKREGMPPDQWCYQPGECPGVMVLIPDYLMRRGYRLPTGPEWEYAARAGTTTDRFFGQSSVHSDDYAWHSGNTQGCAGSIGRLRPNDLGLFDVLGNFMEWCYNPRPSRNANCPCRAGRTNGICEMRCESLRGGNFGESAPAQGVRPRLATYEFAQPHNRWVRAGFRIVRTEL